jgi:hypothetical protein
MEAIPMCLETNKVGQYPSNTTFVYSLITAESATCFVPAKSSSGLYVNQVTSENYIHLWDLNDVYRR